MIARLLVILPFDMAVVENVKFNVYSYEDRGYLVNIFPPVKTDVPSANDNAQPLTLNGQPTFIANGLRIEFRKESFERTRESETVDPPELLMSSALKKVLSLMRYVTRANQINLAQCTLARTGWRLEYLFDDGSTVPEDPKLRRAITKWPFGISVVGLTPQLWDQVYSLSDDFIPPVWDTLRLDAVAALPNIGTAVVLALSCLEVFISQVLDRLAAESPVPNEMWSWLNGRNMSQANPSTEEQFDVLLKIFTGHSLKEDHKLWEAFKNLKSCRNAFLHEGTPSVGKAKKSISERDVMDFLAQTDNIVQRVREWLPPSLRWPEFKTEMTFMFPIRLPGGSSNPDEPLDSLPKHEPS
jgi:hypothetical protein